MINLRWVYIYEETYSEVNDSSKSVSLHLNKIKEGDFESGHEWTHSLRTVTLLFSLRIDIDSLDKETRRELIEDGQIMFSISED